MREQPAEGVGLIWLHAAQRRLGVEQAVERNVGQIVEPHAARLRDVADVEAAVVHEADRAVKLGKTLCIPLRISGAEIRQHEMVRIFVEQHRLDIERSEEHTSELQSLMRISYAVFCLKKK